MKELTELRTKKLPKDEETKEIQVVRFRDK